MAIYRVSIKEVRSLVNPLDGQMWKCGSISEAEIKEANLNGVVESRSWEGNDLVRQISNLQEAREFHVNRIATLMRQTSEFERIVLVLENHTSPIKAYLNDGNHRLAAAYMRGDETITAVIAASNPNGIFQLLPSATAIQSN